MESSSSPVLLFDGVCNLCCGWVNWVLKHEKKHVIMFASLQSSEGQEILKQRGLPTSNFKSLVLVEGNKVYSRSTAALRLGRHMGGFWRILAIGFIFPGFLRNFVYDIVARNRYRWFGKKDSCMIPSPELKERFL